MKATVFVFAYGSNLYTPRMRTRVPCAIPVATGYVCQRAFVSHKRGGDGSAKANAAFTGRRADRVWGVVYRLNLEDKPTLDHHEFLGIGYDQQKTTIITANGLLSAWIYVARREMIDSSLKPYCWYHDFVVTDARHHQLPCEYIAYLERFESERDSDVSRAEKNRRLLVG